MRKQSGQKPLRVVEIFSTGWKTSNMKALEHGKTLRSDSKVARIRKGRSRQSHGRIDGIRFSDEGKRH
jgi:hypothetical protein